MQKCSANPDPRPEKRPWIIVKQSGCSGATSTHMPINPSCINYRPRVSNRWPARLPCCHQSSILTAGSCRSSKITEGRASTTGGTALSGPSDPFRVWTLPNLHHGPRKYLVVCCCGKIGLGRSIGGNGVKSLRGPLLTERRAGLPASQHAALRRPPSQATSQACQAAKCPDPHDHRMYVRYSERERASEICHLSHSRGPRAQRSQSIVQVPYISRFDLPAASPFT